MATRSEQEIRLRENDDNAEKMLTQAPVGKLLGPPLGQGPVKVELGCRPRKGRRSIATGGTRGKRARGIFDPYGVEYLASLCP